MIQLAVAWFASAALALVPGDLLELTLVGDVIVEGTFRSSNGVELILNVAGDPLAVDLALVQLATRDGLALDPAALQSEAQSWAAAQLTPGPTVHPALAGTASALLPGSGHLMLRDWRTWAGYALIDATLLGLGSWYAFHEQAPKAATTFLALDAVFRVYAVREAVRDAQRRRPATQTGLLGGTAACDGAFSLLPLPGGGLTAGAALRCGAAQGLDPTGSIH